MKCSIGRMECYKRNAYHMRKHSRPTPRLAHIINYFFIYLFTYLLSDRLSFARALASYFVGARSKGFATLRNVYIKVDIFGTRLGSQSL